MQHPLNFIFNSPITNNSSLNYYYKFLHFIFFSPRFINYLEPKLYMNPVQRNIQRSIHGFIEQVPYALPMLMLNITRTLRNNRNPCQNQSQNSSCQSQPSNSNQNEQPNSNDDFQQKISELLVLISQQFTCNGCVDYSLIRDAILQTFDPSIFNGVDDSNHQNDHHYLQDIIEALCQFDPRLDRDFLTSLFSNPDQNPNVDENNDYNNEQDEFSYQPSNFETPLISEEKNQNTENSTIENTSLFSNHNEEQEETPNETTIENKENSTIENTSLFSNHNEEQEETNQYENEETPLDSNAVTEGKINDTVNPNQVTEEIEQIDDENLTKSINEENDSISQSNESNDPVKEQISSNELYIQTKEKIQKDNEENIKSDDLDYTNENDAQFADEQSYGNQFDNSPGLEHINGSLSHNEAEEVRKKITDSENNIKIIVKRSIGNRWYQMETTISADGKKSTIEEWHNILEKDVEEFKKEWEQLIIRQSKNS